MTILVSQRDSKSLSFLKSSSKSLPQLLAFGWKDLQITNFNSINPTYVDLSLVPQNSFLDSFNDFYPKLSIVELSKLYFICSSAHSHKNLLNSDFFIEILKKQNIRLDQSLIEVFQLMSTLHLDFLEWLHEKNVSAQELYVLKSLADTANLKQILEQIAQSQASRSEGIQILELAVELKSLIKTDFQTELQSNENKIEKLPSENASQWLKRLKILRYPMRAAQIQKQQSKLEAMAIPKFLNARLIENQDKLLTEIKFQFHNPLELKKNLEALERVYNNFKG